MAIPKLVPRPKFEDYKEEFKEYLIMERKNGIILVRMHTRGGPVKYNYVVHNVLPQAWHVIGNDPENELMILTSTGPYWMGDWEQVDMQTDKGQLDYDLRFYDSTKMVENLIFDIDFPTIAAVNGPGWKTEIALLCDITICTEDSQFSDCHFMVGSVPGDGQGMTFQGLLGTKRAAYYMYTGKNIDAKTALELGLVNEVLPREKLMDRAWEIAETIMKQHRVIRRLTSQIVKRPWKRLIADDLQVHIADEMYAYQLAKSHPNFDLVIKSWKK